VENSMIVKQIFRPFKTVVQTDKEGSINLGQEVQEKSYRVFINDAGQILLDPAENIPEGELWLWKNPEALASLRRGLEQVAAGETRYLGSFAQYADLEIDD